MVDCEWAATVGGERSADYTAAVRPGRVDPRKQGGDPRSMHFGGVIVHLQPTTEAMADRIEILLHPDRRKNKPGTNFGRWTDKQRYMKNAADLAGAVKSTPRCSDVMVARTGHPKIGCSGKENDARREGDAIDFKAS